MSEIDSRPRFHIPVLPIEIPAELLALPNDTEVISINAPAAGETGSGACKAWELIDCIRRTIARQVARRFYLTEAAQILADAHGLNSVELLKDMQYAFAEGHLTIRKFETGLPRRPVRPVPYWSSYVTPADIDAWLRGNNATYRFPVMPEAASAPVEALGDNELMEELLLQPEPLRDAGQLGAQDSTSAAALPVAAQGISQSERLTAAEAIDLLLCCGIQSPIEFRNYETYWLRSAVERGELIFHEASGLKIQPGEYEGIFGLYEETTSRKELNAWLERIGHLKRIPEPAAPVATVPSASVSTDAGSVPAVEPAARPMETVQERDDRRLREFIELGGKVELNGSGAVLNGRQGALQELADREKAKGKKMNDRSDISKRLRKTALRHKNEGCAESGASVPKRILE